MQTSNDEEETNQTITKPTTDRVTSETNKEKTITTPANPIDRAQVLARAQQDLTPSVLDTTTTRTEDFTTDTEQTSQQDVSSLHVYLSYCKIHASIKSK